MICYVFSRWRMAATLDLEVKLTSKLWNKHSIFHVYVVQNQNFTTHCWPKQRPLQVSARNRRGHSEEVCWPWHTKLSNSWVKNSGFVQWNSIKYYLQTWWIYSKIFHCMVWIYDGRKRHVTCISSSSNAAILNVVDLPFFPDVFEW